MTRVFKLMFLYPYVKALVQLLGDVDACKGNLMTFNNLATSVGIQIFPGVPVCVMHRCFLFVEFCRQHTMLTIQLLKKIDKVYSF